jgi:hypothetical protein
MRCDYICRLMELVVDNDDCQVSKDIYKLGSHSYISNLKALLTETPTTKSSTKRKSVRDGN